MNRAEWIAAVALALNVLTIGFSGGVLWSTQQDHSRRIDVQERKTDLLIPKVERIDANVEFLAEQAREERMRRNAR